jgi:hypothetical protein
VSNLVTRQQVADVEKFVKNVKEMIFDFVDQNPHYRSELFSSRAQIHSRMQKLCNSLDFSLNSVTSFWTLEKIAECVRELMNILEDVFYYRAAITQKFNMDIPDL